MEHWELVDFIWSQLDEVGRTEDEDFIALVKPDGVTDAEWELAIKEVQQVIEDWD